MSPQQLAEYDEIMVGIGEAETKARIEYLNSIEDGIYDIEEIARLEELAETEDGIYDVLTTNAVFARLS